jgi:hypothetical protein
MAMHAYPDEADLASLRRTLTLHRDRSGGAIDLEDAVRFAGGPGQFESALITFGKVQVRQTDALVSGERRGLRIGFDRDAVTMRVEEHNQVELAEGPADLRRIVFELARPARAAEIRLRLEPVPRSGAVA